MSRSTTACGSPMGVAQCRSRSGRAEARRPDETVSDFGNVGPFIAWFDCSPASLGDLVIYDTSLKQEFARHVIPRCEVAVRRDEIDAECHPQAIIGDHLYLGRDTDRSGRLKEDALRLDLSSGQVISANPQMYVDDLRAHPRALVIGDFGSLALQAIALTFSWTVRGRPPGVHPGALTGLAFDRLRPSTPRPDSPSGSVSRRATTRARTTQTYREIACSPSSSGSTTTPLPFNTPTTTVTTSSPATCPTGVGSRRGERRKVRAPGATARRVAAEEHSRLNQVPTG